MNTIQLGGTDWNDAVEAYNTRRAQILDYQNRRVDYANAVLDKLID